MKRYGLAIFLLFSQAYAGPYEDALNALKTQYSAEVQTAGELKQWADSAYRLSFSDDNHNSARQFVGNVLRALDLQEKTVDSYLAEPAAQATTPVNNLQARAALSWVESQLTKECRWCKTDEDWAVHRRAAHTFMADYDLKGIGSSLAKSRRKFSGFPFYGDVVKSFSDPVFRSHVIDFEKKLENLAILQAKSSAPIDSNVLSLAVEASQGNRDEAIRLAGLLLSRDSNIVHFFNFAPEKDEAFARSVARIPLLVRLLSSLDQVARQSQSDRFSFDGKFETTNVKNYYFWSGAFVSLKLHGQNYSAPIVTELNLLFPRAYKSLRKFDNLRVSVTARLTGQDLLMLDADEFKQDTIEVMKMSGRGSAMTTDGKLCDRFLLKN
jgi:hypothetical protein